MAARAASRGTPPTAGVGCRAATRWSALGVRVGPPVPGSSLVARMPVTGVPRWVMLWRWTRSGRSGTSSSALSGDSVSRTASTTSRCSSLSLSDSRSSPSGPCPEPARRAVVPASGRQRKRSPVRSTRSSGLAPTNCPAGEGRENNAQLGSSAPQRRSRPAMSIGRARVTSAWRARTTLASSPRSMAATASATADRNPSSEERGTIRAVSGVPGPTPGASIRSGSAAARSRARSPWPAAPWPARGSRSGSGRPLGSSATRVTHSVPSGSRP